MAEEILFSSSLTKIVIEALQMMPGLIKCLALWAKFQKLFFA